MKNSAIRTTRSEINKFYFFLKENAGYFSNVFKKGWKNMPKQIVHILTFKLNIYIYTLANSFQERKTIIVL